MADNATTQTDLAAQIDTAAPTGHEQVPGSDVESAADSDDESDCSDESDSSEGLATFWETAGMMYDNIESSYLDIQPPQYWKRRSVHYDRYKPATLKDFVNDRLLPDPYPPGVTLKYFYIRTLEKADRKWCFRFMDLPPEMRLVVYRELLIFASDMLCFRPRDCVHTAILRTCKQVHTEAKGILYDENLFKVDFGVEAHEHCSLSKRGQVHHDVRIYGHGSNDMKYFTIPQAIDDYPEFFKRIAKLELSVRYSVKGTHHVLADGYWPLNHSLYGLSSFLMDGHRLKSLHLKLDISSEVEEDGYETILYPLQRLRNVQKASIIGHVPEYIGKKLVRTLEGTEPAFNTMKHWRLLTDEARAQSEIYDAMHEDHCGCGECCGLECDDSMYALLDDLREARIEGCFNSRLEENFIARLALVHDHLQMLNVARLQELVTNLSAKRRALTQYKTVSDEGRLRKAAITWVGRILDDQARYIIDDLGDWDDDKKDNAAGIPEEDGSTAVERTEQQDVISEHSNVDPVPSISSSVSNDLEDLGSGAAPIAINTDEVDAMVEEAINGAGAKPSPEL
ncbi:hypothetical protein LTR37_010449 [Vermiconidia calcicola]|uniref:Uncharacterized protein n=1 Tax=Vermiconidia calcicola TaxID=1690605 RepID=A0ACC3N681_9PEZI|nr:hypothetical protein LTR37_010449 [Vermiconidia calcicola]